SRKPVASRLDSNRRFTGGAWTFSPRAGRSTFRGRGRRSGTSRRSACAKVSRGHWTGTVSMAGSKAQDQLFDAGKSARQKYAELIVGRPGLGALLRYEL